MVGTARIATNAGIRRLSSFWRMVTWIERDVERDDGALEVEHLALELVDPPGLVLAVLGEDLRLDLLRAPSSDTAQSTIMATELPAPGAAVRSRVAPAQMLSALDRRPAQG